MQNFTLDHIAIAVPKLLPAIEKYQKFLEQNCPEQFKQVNEEMAFIILGEIIEGR